MAFNLTRMMTYALICALEEDLRTIIKVYAINGDRERRFLPQPLTSKAQQRVEKDIGVVYDDITEEELVDYLDLGDSYALINSCSSTFPNKISATVKKNTSKLEALVRIRNRVMHVRPLDIDDYPTTHKLSSVLSNDDPTAWNHTAEVLDKLRADPSFVLGLEIKAYENVETTNHNLPFPDFDETGLIGRDDEVRKIKNLCLGGFPVISIVGEGGVGKTALALKVAYELIEDAQDSFDSIVWVSSKTSQLTANEVKEIKGAISSSLGVIQEISNQVVGNKSAQENLDEVVEYLATFKILLFIDNLETILDDNIKAFVGSLPQGSKIVITSRIGLGAYEYPIKLQGIHESDAARLLRSLSKLRGVDLLAKSSEGVLRKYVNRMHRNPSYIKWFVSSVQTGTTPEAILQNSDMFLDFCMSNVYDYLSTDAQLLTSSLQCAPGEKDIPELAYLNDFDSITVQKSVQELMATNMLSQSSRTKGASVKTTYQLSELARAYLGKYHKPTIAFQKSIRDKRNKLNSLFEQQMAQRNGNRYSATNIKFREKSDRVVSKMLLDAKNAILNNEYASAFEILQEAQRLAPDFFEVARFLAYFYQKSGNLNDARSNYELAIVLAPNEPQLHYWFGKFLLYEEENVDDAVFQFEEASKIDPDSVDVALALARGYLFLHEFDEARQILDKFEEKIADAENHQVKMFIDTDLQIHYRRADDLSKIGEWERATFHLEKMKASFDLLHSRHKDSYLRNKLNKCRYVLGNIVKHGNYEVSARAQELLKWIDSEAR